MSSSNLIEPIIGNYMVFEINGRTTRVKIYEVYEKRIRAIDVINGHCYTFMKGELGEYMLLLPCIEVEIPTEDDIKKEKKSYWLNY